jgi:hypothetical protein
LATRATRFIGDLLVDFLRGADEARFVPVFDFAVAERFFRAGPRDADDDLEDFDAFDDLDDLDVALFRAGDLRDAVLIEDLLIEDLRGADFFDADLLAGILRDDFFLADVLRDDCFRAPALRFVARAAIFSSEWCGGSTPRG